MAVKTACLSVLLAVLANADRAVICPSCIPLEDLIAPGFGISASRTGLSSAVAYHNGSMHALSTIVGSGEYQTLMTTAFAQHETCEPRAVVYKCPKRVTKPTLARSDDRPWSYAHAVADTIKSLFSRRREVLPLDPVTQMLQAHFLALEPFKSMSPRARAHTTVSVHIPAWLAESPYACNFREAAEATFGRATAFEDTTSSVYTALGYELCRVQISNEVYSCEGAGHLAVLEYDGQIATASSIVTPLYRSDPISKQYSTIASSNSVTLAKWINAFLGAESFGMIALAGPDVDGAVFQQALAFSKLSLAANQVQTHDGIDSKDIAVLGAAQIAKDALENHDMDCLEWRDCLDIRAEADAIAGPYVYLQHKRWSADNNRHWRQQLPSYSDAHPIP